MEDSTIIDLIVCIHELCLKTVSELDIKKILDHLKEKNELKRDSKITWRQLNEILLLCKESRVSKEFFSYFTEGKDFLTVEEFPYLNDRFKKHSMLQFGNFRFAYDLLIKSKNVKIELSRWLKSPEEIIERFEKRLDPILGIQRIEKEKVHCLGYLIEDDATEIREKGIFNTNVYLTSDYLDVYVATSMRDKYDFQSVFDLCQNVFSHPKIKPLKIRYFDPTQSYHDDRLAKGLIEGLMLKRAKCTIYAAQENDSFGKDSELAATLAQGKPVIAYIPKYDSEDTNYLKNLSKLPLKKLLDKAELCRSHVNEDEWDKYTDVCEILSDELAKETVDSIIIELINKSKVKFEEFIKIAGKAESKFYDYRANTFKKLHPLGLQMNLETGVANGVLVTRSYDECVKTLYEVLTNQLEFEIILPKTITKEDKTIEGYPQDELNYLLCEKRTKCVFRLVTTDELLANSFWNFYLGEEDD